MLTSPTPEEIAFLPASEALFLGAALAHVDAFYERQRLRRIDQRNRIALAAARRRGDIR